MIVLDTNVTSELMRPTPSPVVTRWLRSRLPAELYTTSITLAEILYGIERLPDGRRRDLLRSTATDVFAAFADHVLAFDAAAAAEYAQIASHGERAGASIEGLDGQIAAISRVHGAALATRNTQDFRHLGIELIDPWRPES